MAMPQVGGREIRQNLSKYLKRVAEGESFEVTEHGRPVATLGPVRRAHSPTLERLAAKGRVILGTGENLGDRQDQASSVVLDIDLIPLSTEIRGIARSVSPPSLRSLDAIHLATAAALGADLGVLVAHDPRLFDAARDLGLPVASPT